MHEDGINAVEISKAKGAAFRGAGSKVNQWARGARVASSFDLPNGAGLQETVGRAGGKIFKPKSTHTFTSSRWGNATKVTGGGLTRGAKVAGVTTVGAGAAGAGAVAYHRNKQVRKADEEMILKGMGQALKGTGAKAAKWANGGPMTDGLSANVRRTKGGKVFKPSRVETNLDAETGKPIVISRTGGGLTRGAQLAAGSGVIAAGGGGGAYIGSRDSKVNKGYSTGHDAFGISDGDVSKALNFSGMKQGAKNFGVGFKQGYEGAGGLKIKKPSMGAQGARVKAGANNMAAKFGNASTAAKVGTGAVAGAGAGAVGYGVTRPKQQTFGKGDELDAASISKAKGNSLRNAGKYIDQWARGAKHSSSFPGVGGGTQTTVGRLGGAVFKPKKTHTLRGSHWGNAKRVQGGGLTRGAKVVGATTIGAAGAGAVAHNRNKQVRKSDEIDAAELSAMGRHIRGN